MPTVKAVGQISLTDLNDVLAGPTPPTNPQPGALWYDTIKKELKVYSNGQWVKSSRSEEYVRSRGENLVTNGTGLLGDNTNFSQWTFDGSQVFAGAGSFFTNSQDSSKFNDELIAVDASRKYRFSLMAKSLTGLGKNYFGVISYDVDGRSISPYDFYGSQFNVVELTQELKVGDMVAHISNVSQFVDNSTNSSHLHSMVLWGYKNSYGYEYPAGTYSRLSFPAAWNTGAIDRVNNTITFNKPFSVTNPNDPQGIFRVGHKVSPTYSGGTFQYMTASNVNVPKENFQKYSGVITGNGIGSNNFPHGTNFVKLLFLVNRSSSGGQAGDSLWVNSLEFTDVTDIEDLSESIIEIEVTLGNMANDNILDIAERRILKDRLTDIIGFVIGDTTTTLPTATALDASLKGEFYNVRRQALNAGITNTDALYVAVETKYNELKAYLESFTPIDAWDLRDPDAVITVLKTTFRDKWLQYYQASRDLAVATAAAIKNNVDGKAPSTDVEELGQIVSDISSMVNFKAGMAEFEAMQAAFDARVEQDILDKQQLLADLATIEGRTTLVETIAGNSKLVTQFIETVITESEEGVFIGNKDIDTGVLIAPNRISFVDNSVEVAYISNQTMEITHGIFVETATISKFKFELIPGTTIMAVTWVGE